MKRNIMFTLAVIGGLFFVAKLFSLPFVYQQRQSVTTQAVVLGRGILVNRRYMYAENVGTSYDIFIATFNMTYGERTTGKRLTANGGDWEDNYWVYKGSWFAIADQSTTTIYYQEEE